MLCILISPPMVTDYFTPNQVRDFFFLDLNPFEKYIMLSTWVTNIHLERTSLFRIFSVTWCFLCTQKKMLCAWIYWPSRSYAHMLSSSSKMSYVRNHVNQLICCFSRSISIPYCTLFYSSNLVALQINLFTFIIIIFIHSCGPTSFGTTTGWEIGWAYGSTLIGLLEKSTQITHDFNLQLLLMHCSFEKERPSKFNCLAIRSKVSTICFDANSD
jgi:hypothetical protein